MANYVSIYKGNEIDAALAAVPNKVDKEVGKGLSEANFTNSEKAQLASSAPLASPSFTGVPTAPTASVDTNNTQLANTAFVQQEIQQVVDGLADPNSSVLVGGVEAKFIANKLKNVFTPLDFGAIGNGSNNDTAACQLAANAARAANGWLVFPAGYSFGIHGLINVRNGVRGVIGLGGEINILAGPDMSGIVLLGKEAGEPDNVSDCTVSHIVMRCNNRWVVGVYGQNVSRCEISYNKIYDVANGFGILIRSFDNGLSDSVDNKVIGNTITGVVENVDTWQGIAIDAPIAVAPYAGAAEYWKATFTAADSLYHGANNTVANNTVIGGYYGISLSAARFNTVFGNSVTLNTRNISVQNNCIGNTISNNTLRDSLSSAVHLAYGSVGNLIVGNNIRTTRAIGQGLLQAYVGSSNNTFRNNKVVAISSAPQWHIYCAVHSDECVFSDNDLSGVASKAYIAVESAWNTDVTNPAHYGGANNFANRGMGGVGVTRNSISPESAVPAIFISQVGDANGAYTLVDLDISGNTITNSNASRQLELYEFNSGNLAGLFLCGNNFSRFSGPSSFLFPRGRLHFSLIENNVIINTLLSDFPANTAEPSVTIGETFQHIDNIPTNVTYYTGGKDQQEITVRLSVNTVIVHDDNKIRLKGNVNATGDANKFIRLKQLSGIWFEMYRNF